MRRWMPFNRSEGYRLAGFFGFVALLHVTGWGLFAYYGGSYGPAYAGAGSPRTCSDCVTRSTPTTSRPSTTRRGT